MKPCLRIPGTPWIEQIRIAVRLPDEKSDNVTAYQDCTSRIAELTKKGMIIVDTAIQDNEQIFILESKAS